jgi:hypothetical protein
MARLIGEAYVVIYPQGDQFGPQAEAIVKKALSGVRPNVNVRPQLDKAAMAKVESELKGATSEVDVGTTLTPGAVEKLRATIEAALGGDNIKVGTALDAAAVAKLKVQLDAALQGEQVKISTSQAHGDLAELAAQTEVLRDQLDSMRAGVTDTDALAKLTALQVRAEALDAALEKAAKSAKEIDPLPLESRLLAIQAAYQKIAQSEQSLAPALAPMDARIAEIAARTTVLRGELTGLRATLNDADAIAKLAALQVKAETLSRALSVVGASPGTANTGALDAQLLALQAAYGKLVEVQKQEDQEAESQGSIWSALGLKGAGSLIHITDILNAGLPEVKLFGGAIEDMYRVVSKGDPMPTLASHLVSVATSGHLSAEALIEFVAIWGPATIAITAFGAAAVPTAMDVYKQLVNMNTAAKGTGQAFQSLALSGQSVVQAVRPTVLEAFGTALFALQNKSSNFAAVMHSLGQGIDEFAAKAAVAFDSSAASTFFQKGSQDALALMQSFQSLGSIIGSLAKAVPGYAEVLLNFGNALLGVAAKGVSFAEPIIGELLKLHGALLYGGLVGTAAAWVFPKIVSAATSAGEALASMSVKWLGDESAVTQGLGKMLLGLDSISAGPVIAGIGLVAGAIAAVVIYLKASSDAAQAFNKSIEATISSASLGSLQATIQSGINQTTVQYVAAQKQLVTATKAQTAAQNQAVVAGRAGEIQNNSTTVALEHAQRSTQEYGSGLQQLTTQQTNVNSNLAELAKTYGTSIPGALALANGAQVTSNELTAKSANNTATLNAQVGGYLTQLRVMTAGTGTLNQALNALNVTQSAQVTDAQKLATAYSSWIGIVTGGDQAFTTFEQGLGTLSDELAKGSAAGVKLTTSSGKLTEQQKLLGTAMIGTSTSALAARQAFDGQIQSAVTLYGNLQTMATASGNTAVAQTALSKSGRDLVAQLLPLAKGSQEATAQVYALAQVVGYTGPDSFKSLAQWVGNTKGAEDDLNKQQTILTVTTANLTQAAKNLSSAIGQEITQAEASAIEKTDGFQQATLKLAQAVSQSGGVASKAVVTYSVDFYNSLVKAGVGTKQATDQVDAFLAQMGVTGGVVKQVNAVIGNITPQTNFNNATKQNIQSLQSLGGALTTTKTSYGGLFTDLAKEDQGLANNVSSAALAKQAFISFAENGLHLTKTEAQNLWSEQAAQNLTSLAGKAGTTESAFVSYAKNGLHLTTTEAQNLWTQLRLQYLDTLATKAGTSEGAFVNLAKQGLHLTTTEAQNLWTQLRLQYLDTVATKSGETQTQFEHLATQLGLTKTAADNLWTSLHTVAAGSPYSASINAVISANGSVSAVEKGIQAAGGGASVQQVLAQLQFGESGMVVRGGGPSGKDSQLIVAAPGELVIPTSHAPKFRDMARKASIPGFASGGLVANEPGIGAKISSIPTTSAADETVFGRGAVSSFVAAVTQLALAQAAAAAKAAAISLAGVSNSSAVAALQSAAAKAGWTGAQWTALENVEMREAGFSLTATNPTSGAYGMAQFINGPSEYAQYGGNSSTAAGQAVAMVNYIKSRYGTPAAAWQHEQQFGWYGSGGTVKPYSAGGMVSEPVFGYGKFSGMPYSFAERGPEMVSSAGPAPGSGLPPMTQYQAQRMITLMETQNKLLAQMPFSQAQALQQSAAAGVRRGYFATSG